jgi:hypothetical protein
MRLSFAALALAALLTPALAVDFTSPKAVVEALYAPYFQPTDSFDYQLLDATPLHSTGLNALYEKDRQEAADNISRIDFDPYVDGQDFQLSDLVVAEPVYVAGRAIVAVSFANFEQPRDMGYVLVKEGEDWKIDDMWSDAGEYSYDLKDILTAPLSQ